MSVVDLERFADIGQRHGVETLIDATLATPYNLRPIEAGVDYVLHSATKYLGRAQRPAGRRHHRLEAASWSRSASCAASWARSTPRTTIYLLHRGLKTFELRMQRHNENGQRVAEFLAAHPRVEKVYYPGLASHPYHEVGQAARCAASAGW